MSAEQSNINFVTYKIPDIKHQIYNIEHQIVSTKY